MLSVLCVLQAERAQARLAGMRAPEAESHHACRLGLESGTVAHYATPLPQKAHDNVLHWLGRGGQQGVREETIGYAGRGRWSIGSSIMVVGVLRQWGGLWGCEAQKGLCGGGEVKAQGAAIVNQKIIRRR
jgi:hypothetical protein